MEACYTKYGKIENIPSAIFYSTGELEECRLSEYFEINTSIGKLIPRYEDDGVRSKFTKSISFYKSGDVKSVSLNSQMSVSTPIGNIPAELVTFYENGKIKKVFPLNGRITAYWTEQNEYELAKEMEFKFIFGAFKIKVVCVSFYEDGEIKSLTLWQKDSVSINTPCGTINIRIGISMYKNGALRSCEPKEPILTCTPIGDIMAYDINAIGIDGGKNSLNFNEDGTIKSLYTSTDRIEVINKDGKIAVIEPRLKRSLFNDEQMDVIPYRIEFSNGKVIFNNDIKNEFEITECEFKIVKFYTNISSSTNNCDGCGE